MRILFDLINTQFQYSGGAEYVRKVFYSLLNEVKSKNFDIEIIAAIDSSLNWPYKDLTISSLLDKKIRCIDIKDGDIAYHIKKNKIDTLFIGVAQVWGMRYNLNNIDCRVICVIHDLCDEEYSDSNLNLFFHIDNNIFLAKHLMKKIVGKSDKLYRMKGIVKLLTSTDSKVITVSEYSKMSIEYHLPINKDNIIVLYSPERLMESKDSIDNIDLNKLIQNNSIYYLMTNANRVSKNSKRALKAFEKYVNTVNSKAYIVTTGLKEKMFNNHISLPFLSESDLVHAIKNCFAFIFPSFFEGFGYPPVESMKYGKPILSSNTTSMPSILGDAPIYFSPLFETDIFKALNELTYENWNIYSKKSIERYSYLKTKQDKDLVTLIKILCD